ASPRTWRCAESPWTEADPENNRPAWVPPEGAEAYRGVTVFRDAENSWVGTRALWNQHSYHVSNICDRSDDACLAGLSTGSIPEHERPNWSVPWLNRYRQNVQGSGIFDAPDATVTLTASCTTPVELVASVRNLGQASLPPGVRVRFLASDEDGDLAPIGEVRTPERLGAGQVAELALTAPIEVRPDRAFKAEILVDRTGRAFRACRDDNNDSGVLHPRCVF